MGRPDRAAARDRDGLDGPLCDARRSDLQLDECGLQHRRPLEQLLDQPRPEHELDLVSTINCQKGAGRTSYANALEAAQKELETNGRANVKDVIIFLSDGAANIGPTYYSTTSPYRTKPCHQGVSSAAVIKSKGTLIYSIGYDLNANNGGANVCTSYTGADESPAITAYSAIQQIAIVACRLLQQAFGRSAEDDLHRHRRRPAARHVGPDRRERAVTLAAFARRARRAGRAGRNVRPAA